MPNESGGPYLLTEEEVELLAKENQVDTRDICKVCGKVILVVIFKGSGYCSDNHRKVLTGDDPSPYPFRGDPSTGAP